MVGGAAIGSNVPSSSSTSSMPSSPNGATIVTPVIRGGRTSEPSVLYSKRIRNAVSTESLHRPLPQGSSRYVLYRPATIHRVPVHRDIFCHDTNIEC